MKKLPKKNKKGASIDNLAVMVQRGFVETKEDFNKLRSDLENNYSTKSELKEEIKKLKEDIDEMLNHHIGTFRKDYDELASRVRKLEDKVFANR